MLLNMNRLRTILIERLDRLARELLIQECILRVLRDLKKFGVTLLSATEECLDSDPTRILLARDHGRYRRVRFFHGRAEIEGRTFASERLNALVRRPQTMWL